jgi:hypothetical protein
MTMKWQHITALKSFITLDPGRSLRRRSGASGSSLEVDRGGIATVRVGRTTQG